MNNVPELSVSEISLALKKTVEDAFGRVRVRGELSRITIARSGHLYTCLKDDNAVLDAVCWRGTLGGLSLRPEEGMEVICTGRMTTFPGNSRYQLVIEAMEPAGEGALLKMLEERKKKLAAEGLFDADRKKPLPFLPRTIGVVTSPTGAVIRDIIHRIRDRFPSRIIIWPVPVQGEGAEAGITAGINGLNALGDDSRPDVIIVARGGGSLEDLMAFNAESVVRAVAASHIPVISAVGHETDMTLIDFAADLRAPTPTGAAEKAVPVLEDLSARLLDNGLRLRQCASRLLTDSGRHLETIARILAYPARMLESFAQRYDVLAGRVGNGFERQIDRMDKSLHGLAGRLRSPQSLLDAAHLKASHLGDRLNRATPALTEPRQDRLAALSRMLEGLSYKNILERGYAVLRDDRGRLLETVESIDSAATVEATVKDGPTIVRGDRP